MIFVLLFKRMLDILIGGGGGGNIVGGFDKILVVFDINGLNDGKVVGVCGGGFENKECGGNGDEKNESGIGDVDCISSDVKVSLVSGV